MIKRFNSAAIVAAGIFAMAGPASAAVIFSDNFEGYADTPAMQTIWGSAGAGTLDATNGFGGSKAMAHPAGADNIVTFPAFSPTDAVGLRLSGKIFDDAAGNKRFSIGTRSAATFPLFEMGMYNAATAMNYATRVTTFPGASPGWTSLGPDTTNLADSGWHSFVAEFTLDSVSVTLDLDSNGSIDLSDTFALSGANYSAGLNQVRLGGPSSLSSPGGGGLFDDIVVETFAIPEPSGLALLGVAALGLGRRARAARKE